MFFRLTLIIIIILVIGFIALWIKQKRKKAAHLKERHNKLIDVYANIKVLIGDTSEESPENAKLLSTFEKIFSEKTSKVLESDGTSETYDQLDREFLNVLSALVDISEKNDPTLLIEQIKGGKTEGKTIGSIRKTITKKNQTILVTAIMVFIFSPFSIFFANNFVQSPSVSKFSVYIAGVFTVFFILLFIYLRIKNIWCPNRALDHYSKVKRAFLIAFMPAFFFMLFWINLAIPIPWLFTALSGEYHTRFDIVIKEKELGRRNRSCDFRFELKSVDPLFFHYCITENLYNQLPDEELEAELTIKESVLGYIVEDIKLINEVR